LCTSKCLEAAIEQAGLEKEVQAFEVLSDKAEAVLGLASEHAAQRCIRHFHGLKWAKKNAPVSARYCAQARHYLEAQGQDQQQENEKPQAPNSAQVSDCASEKSAVQAEVEEPMKNANEEPIKSPDVEEVEEIEINPCTPRKMAYTPSIGSPSTAASTPTARFELMGYPEGVKPPRWADYDSDDEPEDDCRSGSTFSPVTIGDYYTSDGGEYSD